MLINVLIVDDYPMNRDLLRRMLPDAEFSVVEAQDGLEALQLLSVKQFDVVLLDVMMPGMDGIEVCRHLRDDLNQKELPVFFITALDTDESINALLDDYTSYFRKPFNKAEIREKLKRVVESKH